MVYYYGMGAQAGLGCYRILQTMEGRKQIDSPLGAGDPSGLDASAGRLWGSFEKNKGGVGAVSGNRSLRYSSDSPMKPREKGKVEFPKKNVLVDLFY